MYRIVIDKGTSKNYMPVSSEWSAKMICDKYRFVAKNRGDKVTRFYYEKGEYDPVTHIWRTEERSVML